MFDFQKLEVYKKAKFFHKDMNKLLKSTKFERYVNDQLGRASFSIALNIAEGSAKFSKPDRRNYFNTARGSVFECVAVLDILHDDGLIEANEFNTHLQKADELSRMLYTMIKNWSQKVESNKQLNNTRLNIGKSFHFYYADVYTSNILSFSQRLWEMCIHVTSNDIFKICTLAKNIR